MHAQIHRWPKGRVLLSLGVLLAMSLAVVVTSWVYMLKPTTVYSTRTYPNNTQNENDPFLVLIGGHIMIVFTALTIGVWKCNANTALTGCSHALPHTLPLLHSTHPLLHSFLPSFTHSTHSTHAFTHSPPSPHSLLPSLTHTHQLQQLSLPAKQQQLH